MKDFYVVMECLKSLKILVLEGTTHNNFVIIHTHELDPIYNHCGAKDSKKLVQISVVSLRYFLKYILIYSLNNNYFVTFDSNF